METVLLMIKKALVLDALHTLRERQKITWKVMNSLKLSI